MRRLFEYIEYLLRAYRLSDDDIMVMAKRGYGFDLNTRKWVRIIQEI